MITSPTKQKSSDRHLAAAERAERRRGAWDPFHPSETSSFWSSRGARGVGRGAELKEIESARSTGKRVCPQSKAPKHWSGWLQWPQCVPFNCFRLIGRAVLKRSYCQPQTSQRPSTETNPIHPLSTPSKGMSPFRLHGRDRGCHVTGRNMSSYALPSVPLQAKAK